MLPANHAEIPNVLILEKGRAASICGTPNPQSISAPAALLLFRDPPLYLPPYRYPGIYILRVGHPAGRAALGSGDVIGAIAGSSQQRRGFVSSALLLSSQEIDKIGIGQPSPALVETVSIAAAPEGQHLQ